MRTRKVIRLQAYDYSREAWYFVTIEPFDRKYPFCKILDRKIILNDIGKIIDNQWRWIFSRYNHIAMDEYIIMPDHFHGIIRFLPELNNECADAGAYIGENVREAPEPPIHLNHRKRLDLSHIIGAFKTTSSKLIHEARYQNFKWKRSFHDRILRIGEIEIRRQYIRNNPLKWVKNHYGDKGIN